MSAHGDLAIVGRDVLEGARVGIVSYRAEKMARRDSGFDLFSGREPADEFFAKVERDPERYLATVCLHCLIEAHPEAGRGMDLARDHGFARHDGKEWVAS
jgi:hypothetical protein